MCSTLGDCKRCDMCNRLLPRIQILAKLPVTICNDDVGSICVAVNVTATSNSKNVDKVKVYK